MMEIKSQVLADFITEWTEVQIPPLLANRVYWTMYFDGSFMAAGAGTRVILVSLIGDRLEYAIRLHFQATNNVAKYETLIHGLRIASELSACRLYVRGDLELVVSQVMKEASCRDNKTVINYDEVWRLKERFNGSSSTTSLGVTTSPWTSWPRSCLVETLCCPKCSSTTHMSHQSRQHDPLTQRRWWQLMTRLSQPV